MKNIKNWYKFNFPNDEVGNEINPIATFEELEKNIPNVYDYLHIGDSIARERIFTELTIIMKVDYDSIYHIWLYGYEKTIISAGENLTKAKNDFMNKIYKSFKIPQLVEWLDKKLKKRCKHLNTEFVYRDFAESYIEYKCLDCGEKIFEDL